jgi:hypothetical protein
MFYEMIEEEKICMASNTELYNKYLKTDNVNKYKFTRCWGIHLDSGIDIFMAFINNFEVL